MREYIGKREHLRNLIRKMYRYDRNTGKFADILSGKKTKVLLGYPRKEAAKAYGVSTRAKIILTRGYALHMDNSGHFTGKGYGKRGHDDPRPLTIVQISKIPEVIKTATEHEIKADRKIRGLQRYKIIKEHSRGQTVVVEVSVTNNEISLVTAYNLAKKTTTPQSRSSIRSRIECTSPQSYVRNGRPT